MEDLKIVIWDINDLFWIKISKYFKNARLVKSLKEIIEVPDLLIINYSKHKRGCLMKRLEAIGFNKSVIILSDFKVNHCFLDFIPYDITIDNLIDIINKTNFIDLKIYNLLNAIGIPKNLKGYNYLKDSIEYLFFKELKMNDLYKHLSDVYNTSSKSIEKAIRNAIEISWNRANLDFINNIFGSTLSLNKDRPTNSEYIYTLCEFIRVID